MVCAIFNRAWRVEPALEDPATHNAGAASRVTLGTGQPNRGFPNHSTSREARFPRRRFPQSARSATNDRNPS